MPFVPYVIDESVTHTEGGAVRVPEGYYLLKVDSITASPEEEDGKPYHQWYFVVERGPGGLGSRIRFRTYTSPKAFFKMGGILKAMGANPDAVKNISIPNYAAHVKLAADLQQRLGGKLVGAIVLDERSQNGQTVFSAPQEFFPTAEYETRSAGAPPASRAAAAAAAPANGPVPSSAELVDTVAQAFAGLADL